MITESLNSIAEAINELGNVSFLEIISLIISTASLIFAVLIPIRIANKQDRIALFEKRFMVYLELMKIVQFSDWLKNQDKDNTTIIEAFVVAERKECIINQFIYIFNVGTYEASNYIFEKKIHPAIEKSMIIINTIPFLYGKRLKNNQALITEDIDNIYRKLIEFMKNVSSASINTIDDTSKRNFTCSVENFIKKYKVILIKPLKL